MRNWGGLRSFIRLARPMDFTKPSLDIERQIELLKSRGLRIEDEQIAKECLSSISYYRLSGYFLTRYKDPKTEHKFYPDSTFQQILDTYIFDRKLRVLFFDQIEKIEVAFRTRMALHLSLAKGPWWYQDSAFYAKADIQLRDNFCLKLSDNYIKSKEEFIKAFKAKYRGPLHNLAISKCADPLPPWWIAVEIMTLPELSRLYNDLNRKPATKGNLSLAINQIAQDFDVVDKRLGSWLKTISFLRNVCAHHGRLWNRSNPNQPSQPNRDPRWLANPIALGDQGKLYTSASIIKYLLDRVAGPNTFKASLEKLFTDFPTIPKNYMGFPQDWQSEKLWA